MEEIKKVNKDQLIIIITAYGDVKDAVRAVKLGAFDYIAKPFENEELILAIKKSLKTSNINNTADNFRENFCKKTYAEEILLETPCMKQILAQIKMIATTNMTVILQGETGTGKEVIARLIRQNSLRRDKPYIIIDCGTIPDTLVESELFGFKKGAFTGADKNKEGKFEQANGGTIFLDEINNLSYSVQMKLLRIIQERKIQHLGGKEDFAIDVRIIAATNINLSEAVKSGKFREDLFHRLNEFIIEIPPLRERRKDIPILVKHFLDLFSAELSKNIEGISTEAMNILFSYQWPGNIRELRNVIKRAVLLTDSNYVGSKNLLLDNNTFLKNNYFLKEGTQKFEKETPLRDIIRKTKKDIEMEMIKSVLTRTDGNKAKAARILKIDRMTLYSKIKEFQVE